MRADRAARHLGKAAALMLAAESKLKLSDPPHKYLKELAPLPVTMGLLALAAAEQIGLRLIRDAGPAERTMTDRTNGVRLSTGMTGAFRNRRDRQHRGQQFRRRRSCGVRNRIRQGIVFGWFHSIPSIMQEYGFSGSTVQWLLKADQPS